VLAPPACRDRSWCAEEKPSWTSKLLSRPELLCEKVREEAGELCQTLEASEGKERAASEMADLLYHSMVLLNVQVRPCALHPATAHAWQDA
jgi:phosphoribosyl-ATP pyrophosphohydrolase